MPDVDALLRGMTAAQVAGWAAFAELEPFGPLRDDYRAAVAACVVANSIPFRGKGAKPLKPGDVMTSLAPPARKQTAREMAAFARQQTLALGGEVRTISRAPDVQARRPGNRNRR